MARLITGAHRLARWNAYVWYSDGVLRAIRGVSAGSSKSSVIYTQDGYQFLKLQVAGRKTVVGLTSGGNGVVYSAYVKENMTDGDWSVAQSTPSTTGGSFSKDLSDRNIMWLLLSDLSGNPTVYWTTDGGASWDSWAVSAPGWTWTASPSQGVSSAHDGTYAYLLFSGRETFLTHNRLIKIDTSGSVVDDYDFWNAYDQATEGELTWPRCRYTDGSSVFAIAKTAGTVYRMGWLTGDWEQSYATPPLANADNIHTNIDSLGRLYYIAGSNPDLYLSYTDDGSVWTDVNLGGVVPLGEVLADCDRSAYTYTNLDKLCVDSWGKLSIPLEDGTVAFSADRGDTWTRSNQAVNVTERTLVTDADGVII